MAMKQQIISLFRCFLEFSGGKADFRQHNFRGSYTTKQNAFFCANFLGVFCSRQFGRFDPKEMHSALCKAKLFAGFPTIDLPDTVKWSHRMMLHVPVGFPENYLVRCYRS